MDIWHGILKFMDHERWKLLGLLLAIGILIGFVGCEITVPSTISAEKQVTQEVFEMEVLTTERTLADSLIEYEALGKKLDAEVAEHNAQVEFGRAGFERKVEFRRKFINLIGGAATSLLTGQPLQVAGIASSFLTLLSIGVGVGAMADSKRKDVVLKKNKAIPT